MQIVKKPLKNHILNRLNPLRVFLLSTKHNFNYFWRFKNTKMRINFWVMGVNFENFVKNTPKKLAFLPQKNESVGRKNYTFAWFLQTIYRAYKVCVV